MATMELMDTELMKDAITLRIAGIDDPAVLDAFLTLADKYHQSKPLTPEQLEDIEIGRRHFRTNPAADITLPAPMKRSIAFLLCFFLFAAVASAQITVFGKVFRKDGETIVPVAGAIIEGESIIRDKKNAVASDENGIFTLEVYGIDPDPVVIAKTDDFSLAGFGQFVSNGKPVEIELVPAAALKGRLIHPNTGKPLAKVNINCAIHLSVEERMVFFPYGTIITDAEGHFSVKGLVPGKMYCISWLNPKEKVPNCLIGNFLALNPEEFDSGDIAFFDIPRTSPQMEDFYLGSYRHEESPMTRFEKAIRQSKESQKSQRPILVLFVHANKLHDTGLKNWIASVHLGIQGQKYLAGYEYVPVDVTNPQASELAEKLGTKLPEKNTFTIVVCDSDGKQITKRDSANFNAPRFKPDGELLVEFNPVLLLTFLKKFGKHD